MRNPLLLKPTAGHPSTATINVTASDHLEQCASMKLDVNLPRKKSEDSDEEDVFAISDRWTFEWTSRRWSRLQDIDGFLGHQEGEGLPNGGGGGAPLKAATSSESVLTDLSESPISQVQCGGQTPSQLLIEPHPPRSSAMHLSPLMFKDQLQQDVIMVLKFPSNSPVTHVAANTLPHLATPAVVTVTCSRVFAVNRWHNTAGVRGAPGYSLEQAHHLPIEMDALIAGNSGSGGRQISDLVDQSISINSLCFLVTADNHYILACGFWDNSFRVYSSETGSQSQIVFGHWDVVTCLARSESYIGGDCYVVSGSRDATLLLWYWSGRHHAIGDNANNSKTPNDHILHLPK
ncbi:unnamed protein product [Boreogadus saida]